MVKEKLFMNFHKSKRQYSLYLVGGLILISWLVATPAGILGKSDAVGYAVCHRIDTRSFHIGIIQLPLCARCTGQYLGAITGLLFLGIFGQRRTGTPPRYILGILIMLVLAYAMDGLNSYLYLPPIIKIFPGMPHLYQPSNTMRLITGTGLGLVIAILLYPTFVGSIIPAPDPRPVIRNIKSMIVLLSLGVIVDLLILTGSKYVLLPAALLSTGGVVLLLTMVYTIIWIRIFHQENQFNRISQITMQLIAGFIVTITQIAFFDLFRFIITGTWNGIMF